MEYFKPSGAETGVFREGKVNTFLLMAWLFALPVHQQWRYWLNKYATVVWSGGGGGGGATCVIPVSRNDGTYTYDVDGLVPDYSISSVLATFGDIAVLH